MSTDVVLHCSHVSESGGEGPVRLLGRWPVLWVCDGCGRLRAAPHALLPDFVLR